MLHIRNLQRVASTARGGQGGPSWRLGARPALGDKHAELASLSWRNRKYVERMLKSGKSKHGTKEETLRDCENEVTLSSRTHRRGRRPKEVAACPAGPWPPPDTSLRRLAWHNVTGRKDEDILVLYRGSMGTAQL